MVAAILLSPRATAGYGVVALVCGALLGIYDQQYNGETLGIQLTRLVLIAVGAGAAVGVCAVRQRREREASRLAAAQAADHAALRLVETLQRSMLTGPPQLPRLATATRYRPATRGAHIGGDWYDAFGVPDGTTMVVIGDVAGHDAAAVAVMARVRALLRGLARSVIGSPAAVLSALDRARLDLGLQTAQGCSCAGPTPGTHRPRWSPSTGVLRSSSADRTVCWDSTRAVREPTTS